MSSTWFGSMKTRETVVYVLLIFRSHRQFRSFDSIWDETFVNMISDISHSGLRPVQFRYRNSTADRSLHHWLLLSRKSDAGTPYCSYSLVNRIGFCSQRIPSTGITVVAAFPHTHLQGKSHVWNLSRSVEVVRYHRSKSVDEDHPKQNSRPIPLQCWGIWLQLSVRKQATRTDQTVSGEIALWACNIVSMWTVLIGWRVRHAMRVQHDEQRCDHISKEWCLRWLRLVIEADV